MDDELLKSFIAICALSVAKGRIVIMDEFNSDSLYSVFSQVIRLHHHRIHSVLEKVGIYPGQPPLLFILKKYGGLSQRELADKLRIKPATITVMLRRMEKAGLVERRQDVQDQRIFRVYLTEQGEKISEEVREVIKSLDTECFNNFTEEELVLLRRFFMQMRDNLLKADDRKLDV